MRDKDFDELFKTKLDDFEMQPAAGVWKGIDRGLTAGKRRKMLMPFLSAAASIVVLITAGIWFIPQWNVLKIKNTGKNNISITTKPVVAVVAPNKQDTAVPAPNNIVPVATVSATRAIQQNETQKDTALPAQHIANAVKYEPQKSIPEVIIATVPQTPQPVISKVVVPGADVPLAVKNAAENTVAVVEQPTVKEDQNAAPVKVRHKVRTLGGLLNLAIAKVDKRKDKVIEFAETDDEESNVTAVNLGIIKIKKEK